MRGRAAADREGGVICPFYEMQYARDERGSSICWLDLWLGLWGVDTLLVFVPCSWIWVFHSVCGFVG